MQRREPPPLVDKYCVPFMPQQLYNQDYGLKGKLFRPSSGLFSI